MAATADLIDDHIARVRRLLSLCSETLEDFDTDILRVLKVADVRAYGHLIDSFYLFEDTQLAKRYVQANGTEHPRTKAGFGLAYLTFYGVMNACYLQQQAIIICVETLRLQTSLTGIRGARIVQFRNDFAAHSPNRGKGDGLHSFILDRFGLAAGSVSGYSSNSPDGFTSRDAKLDELLSEWDDSLEPVLGAVRVEVERLVKDAGVGEI